MLLLPLMLLLAVPATIVATATTHLKSTGDAVCTFHNNSQLADPGSKFTLPPVTANSPQECCDICGANGACKGAVLYGNGCYQKTKVLPITPQTPPPGVPLVACVLVSRPPPPPPAPHELACRHWNATTAWKDAGCSMDGSNCVLDIKVTASAGASVHADSAGAGADAGAASAASWSTLPFVPPHRMQLPAAKVTAVVADAPTAADPEQVAIQLSTNATALYVVLTTLAQGRFSDNVIMLESRPNTNANANANTNANANANANDAVAAAAEGAATSTPSSSEAVVTVTFISWGGPMNSTGIALLKSSLRVEHLADNL